MLGDITAVNDIYIICGYTDMRKSIDGLCTIIRDQLNMSPEHSNALYLFCGRRSDRIKAILHEKDGFVLLYKRLDSKVGRYRWPRNKDEVKSISWKQFEWLMDGLETAKGNKNSSESLILLGFPFCLWYNETSKYKELKAMPSGVKDIQLIELKDTISQLNTTISTQNELISSLQAMLKEREEKDAKKDQLIENLQAQLEYLKNKLFGSTSEIRRDLFPGQMNLFDTMESDEKPAETIEPEELIPVKAHTKKRKSRATYDEMFAGIPTKTVEVDTLTDEQKTCGICGTKMVPIGHEIIRTEVVYTEPKLERIDYVATTYGCPECKDTEAPQFVKDEGKPALIAGSYMSASLMSHIMYFKFAMSVPFYRQEKDFEHLGARISRSTMANDVIYCADEYFQPMYEYFHRQLLKRKYLMADETPIQVLKEEGRRPQTKSYVWLVRTGDDGEIPIILYNYTPTRAGANAAEFLKDAEPGYYLMTDGYQGYNKVPDANRCCCWAHIRRYWLRAVPKGHEKDYTHPAVQGLLYCNKLFEYERIYREKGLSLKQIQRRRLKDEKPVIEAFLSWLDKLKPEASDGIRKAVTYTNNCRPYMMNYLQDGACSLSNNLSENSIRPLVVGRKNWLFSDTPAGAAASMRVYSMVETAKANGLDSLKYLTFLLEHRPSAEMSDEELEQLAPWSQLAQETCN